jgi:hypothetical protein
MTFKLRFLFFLAGFGLLLTSDGHTLALRNSGTAVREQKRIRFQINTIEEASGVRKVLSETTVEGAPGTDFSIDLQSAGYKLKARFLTDLINEDALKVRARLETRRFFGYSEQKLPIYEEDNQSQDLQLSFDEGIVLLPFGSHGGPSVLKIEITPVWSSQTVRDSSGKLQPVQINPGNIPPGGSINIQAGRKPHRFEVDAALYEDGREVARGSGNSLLEEATEFVLRADQPAGKAATNPLAVNFKIADYSRGRPVDGVVIAFDLYDVAPEKNSSRVSIVLGWTGAGELGSELKYDLTNHYLSGNGHRYELRFTVKLGAGEVAD